MLVKFNLRLLSDILKKTAAFRVRVKKINKLQIIELIKNIFHFYILQGFTGRDGKLDYDKLFNSLHNRSFRRRWLKAATLYLSDWANYLAEPEVYNRYVLASI